MPLLEQYRTLFGEKPHMRRVLALIYHDILKFHKKAIRMFRGKSRCQSNDYCLPFLTSDS